MNSPELLRLSDLGFKMPPEGKDGIFTPAKPLSAQKAFSECTVLGDAGVSTQLSNMHLGLPMFRGLRREHVLEVHNSISKVLKIGSD